MHSIDFGIIILYFLLVIGVGLWYQRRASKSLDSYFLGGKSMHWLALAMSGSVATFDITGTMWMVSLIVMFGMKSVWNHWMWGFLMAAFFMAYMGKWVRRSNVMTGAEWMVTRFGDGPDGRTARMAYSLMAVVTMAGFIGYAFQGIGKFASVYVDFGLDPQTSIRVCALAVFAITTFYVLLGGLYSVVATNVIQTVILTLASLFIAGVAYTSVTPEAIALATPTDGTSLSSLVPQWHLAHAANLPAAYAGYEFFGLLAVVWVIKGLLLNMGGPGQMYDFQTFLAARDARDAAKVGAAWSWFLVVRWAMIMGIALLAVTGLVHQRDPEQVMPVVLQQFLPTGVRGLAIAGLLAAFMSTFSATVNAGASYIVRDFWQPLVRPQADQKHLIRASYVATLGLVLIGTMIGMTVASIGQILNWIMMELGAAFVIPNVLRWYWWRINGYGYAAGTLVGLAAAIAVPLLPNTLPLYVTFPTICGLSLIGCLAGTWLTPPTETSTLIAFFDHVRPFGVWGPIRERSGLSAQQLHAPGESMLLAVVNVVLAGLAILGIYLAPMYLVGHWHTEAILSGSVAAAAIVCLYFTWYRTLPAPGQ